jgi:hypothetical protein
MAARTSAGSYLGVSGIALFGWHLSPDRLSVERE